MKHMATEMQKGGVPLGSENLSHLVFNPCVDFTQLNAWHNPDINRLFWEYTQTHTHTLSGRDWLLVFEDKEEGGIMFL